jgi:hypothetical protein
MMFIQIRGLLLFMPGFAAAGWRRNPKPDD